MSRWSLLLLCIVGSSCSRTDALPSAQHEDSRARSVSSVAASALAPAVGSAVSTPEPLSPLRGNWLERLDGEAGSVAFVALPLGARERRPLLVATHGSRDRAEWACGGWRLAVRAHAFVLCPQGSAVAGNVYGWPSAAALKTAVERALVALQRRFGAHVAEGTPVYAGFSQGAILAAPLLLESATQFATAVFAEGGYASLESADFARNYQRNGGRNVLIACGTVACFSRAGRARPALERAGLRVLVGGDAAAGHNLNARMQAALRGALGELLRDDPRWHLGP